MTRHAVIVYVQETDQIRDPRDAETVVAKMLDYAGLNAITETAELEHGRSYYLHPGEIMPCTLPPNGSSPGESRAYFSRHVGPWKTEPFPAPRANRTTMVRAYSNERGQ